MIADLHQMQNPHEFWPISYGKIQDKDVRFAARILFWIEVVASLTKWHLLLWEYTVIYDAR